MTFKELFISFTENVRDKSKNPFFGTLILVWILKNWRLLYSMFNFDSTFTLHERLSYINNYFIQNPFLPGVGRAILWTFGAITVSYILVNAARFIVDFFEKKVTPTVIKWNDEFSIVTRDSYNIEVLKNEALEGKYQKERNERIRISAELEESEKKAMVRSDPVAPKKGKNDNYVLSTDAYTEIEKNIVENNWVDHVYLIKRAIEMGEHPNVPEEVFNLFLIMGLIALNGIGTNQTYHDFTEKGRMFMEIFIDRHFLKKAKGKK